MIDIESFVMLSKMTRTGDPYFTAPHPRIHPKKASYRSEQYLKFVRQLPCYACQSRHRVEAHHCWKCRKNDFTAIPLCVPCHEFGIHAGSEQQWLQDHKIDLMEAVMRCLMLYLSHQQGGDLWT